MNLRKNLFSLLLAMIAGQLLGQDPATESRFFFPEFQEASVYYKDGRTFRIPANYDLVRGSFVFIDKEGGDQIKLFGDQQNIGSVKVGNRVFLATPFGPTEIIQVEPNFKVHYKPRLREASKSGGYGTSSSASATRTMSHLVQNGPTNYLEKSDGSVAEIINIYTVSIGKKQKQFENEKQFLKLYPKQEKALTEYMLAEEVDFNVVPQVLALYNYAQTLSN